MANKKKSANVPGQYLGYSLQPTLLLTRLLDGQPGLIASLEVFDDIGLETADGEKKALQGKSALVNNPISNRSIDLWKTIGNWISSVKNGELDIKSTMFEIYVSTEKTGDIVRTFSDAKTEEDAQKALNNAKIMLWGEAPAYPLKSEIGETLSPYLDYVFIQDHILVSKIISRFSLTCGSGSPQTDLKNKLMRAFVPEELIEDALKWALGWVKRKTDLLLEKQKPAYVFYDEFHSEMVSWVRKSDRRTILQSYSTKPSKEQVEIDINNFKTYIRQLDLISCDYEDKLQAVNDYLMASCDRTKWAELGLTHDTSFDDFEDGLIRTWHNGKQQIKLMNPEKDELIKGKLLYYKCISHQQMLEGLQVPNHFTPGSFHELSDKKVIGWHSNYTTELERDHGIFNGEED